MHMVCLRYRLPLEHSGRWISGLKLMLVHIPNKEKHSILLSLFILVSLGKYILHSPNSCLFNPRFAMKIKIFKVIIKVGVRVMFVHEYN